MSEYIINFDSIIVDVKSESAAYELAKVYIEHKDISIDQITKLDEIYGKE